MNILSLFDGISCGQLALQRAGIGIENYFASEVESQSIEVTQKHFPNTVQLGDIQKLDVTSLPKIDVLIGGSPCQNLSFAGKMQGLDMDGIEISNLKDYLNYKSQGMTFTGQSYLFWEYVRVLQEVRKINPNVLFFLENVKMASKWKVLFDNILGVEGIEINSSLVSAQDRKRFYWTNIPFIGLPEDKNISLVDILIENYDKRLVFPEGHSEYFNYDKSKVDKNINKITPIQVGNSKQFRNAVKNSNKAYTLRATNPNGILDENWKIRRYDPVEVERLQTLPDNYTKGFSRTRRYKMVGNGWTVDIISWFFSFIE